MGNIFTYHAEQSGVDDFKPSSNKLGRFETTLVDATPEKQQRVKDWYDKYYDKYFAPIPEQSSQRIYTIVRADIPIGWCKKCGYHITFHALVWCPECGLKEPLEIRENFVNKRHSI